MTAPFDYQRKPCIGGEPSLKTRSLPGNAKIDGAFRKMARTHHIRGVSWSPPVFKEPGEGWIVKFENNDRGRGHMERFYNDHNSSTSLFPGHILRLERHSNGSNPASLLPLSRKEGPSDDSNKKRPRISFDSLLPSSPSVASGLDFDDPWSDEADGRSPLPFKMQGLLATAKLHSPGLSPLRPDKHKNLQSSKPPVNPLPTLQSISQRPGKRPSNAAVTQSHIPSPLHNMSKASLTPPSASVGGAGAMLQELVVPKHSENVKDLTKPKEVFVQILLKIMSEPNFPRQVTTQNLLEAVRAKHPYYAEVFNQETLKSNIPAYLSQYTQFFSKRGFVSENSRSCYWSLRESGSGKTSISIGDDSNLSITQATAPTEKKSDSHTSSRKSDTGKSEEEETDMNVDKLYYVRQNRSEQYVIASKNAIARKWASLPLVNDFQNMDERYVVGDVVAVLLDEDKEDYARIFEMRRISKTSVAAAVLWYKSRADTMKQCTRNQKEKWLETGPPYMLTNEIGVLSVFTVTKKMSTEEARTLFSNANQILDLSARGSPQIRDTGDKQVLWLRPLLGARISQDGDTNIAETDRQLGSTPTGISALAKGTTTSPATAKTRPLSEPGPSKPQAKEPQTKMPQLKMLEPMEPISEVSQTKITQAKDSQAKDSQAKDPQVEDSQAKEPQAKEPQAKEHRSPKPQVKQPQTKTSHVADAAYERFAPLNLHGANPSPSQIKKPSVPTEDSSKELTNLGKRKRESSGVALAPVHIRPKPISYSRANKRSRDEVATWLSKQILLMENRAGPGSQAELDMFRSAQDYIYVDSREFSQYTQQQQLQTILADNTRLREDLRWFCSDLEKNTTTIRTQTKQINLIMQKLDDLQAATQAKTEQTGQINLMMQKLDNLQAATQAKTDTIETVKGLGDHIEALKQKTSQQGANMEELQTQFQEIQRRLFPEPSTPNAAPVWPKFGETPNRALREKLRLPEGVVIYQPPGLDEIYYRDDTRNPDGSLKYPNHCWPLPKQNNLIELNDDGVIPVDASFEDASRILKALMKKHVAEDGVECEEEHMHVDGGEAA